MRIVAIVGLPGAGKSVVADWLVERGFGFVRLGQITLDIVKEKGLEPTEANERPIRESIRKEHGMAAYATLNFAKIDELLKKGNVVADDMISWEEYLAFKEKYGSDFTTLFVCASPKTRYARLAGRKYDPVKDPKMRHRSYTPEEAKSRDYAQIEKLHQGGPIAMADFTIVNEGSMDDLKSQFKRFAGLFLGK
jgi:dephospho-CoA kinase